MVILAGTSTLFSPKSTLEKKVDFQFDLVHLIFKCSEAFVSLLESNAYIMATKSDDTLQISLLGFIRILAISSNRRCT
jgi:hypothetical protein